VTSRTRPNRAQNRGTATTEPQRRHWTGDTTGERRVRREIVLKITLNACHPTSQLGRVTPGARTLCTSPVSVGDRFSRYHHTGTQHTAWYHQQALAWLAAALANVYGACVCPWSVSSF